MASEALKPDLIGCPECDLLGEIPTLAPGERARCSRCGFVLSVSYADPFGRAFALGLSALIMLLVAMSFPFLSITASGVSNSMTLLETVSYLAEYGAEAISILVLFFVVLVPMIMLVLIVLLSLSLRAGRFSPVLRPPARWLFHLNAWAMVEVFAIGVIVSLVKLAAMAHVELGLSFWAYLAFSVLFLLAFSSMDRLTVWTTVERVRGSRS
ncbi:MAG TPA: paraquat-inducible protein A [Pseudomonadales bacterium]